MKSTKYLVDTEFLVSLGREYVRGEKAGDSRKVLEEAHDLRYTMCRHELSSAPMVEAFTLPRSEDGLGLTLEDAHLLRDRLFRDIPNKISSTRGSEKIAEELNQNTPLSVHDCNLVGSAREHELDGVISRSETLARHAGIEVIHPNDLVDSASERTTSLSEARFNREHHPIKLVHSSNKKRGEDIEREDAKSKDNQQSNDKDKDRDP